LQITALHSLVLACGSMVLGLAASHGVIDAQQTFHAANVDETFQMEQWGTDAELEKRRTQAMQDISAAIDFLRLIDGFWG
jgi:chaperone required for assembly of F1-ATPase